MRPRATVTFALVLTLLVPAAAAEGKRKQPRRVAKVRLASFGTCNELVGYARAQALRTGGGSGMTVRALPGTAVGLAPPAPVALERGAAVTPTAAPRALAEDTTFSGTNNQEAAVDESDIVKTDGRRAYVVYGDRLLVVDVTLDTPKLLGTLKLEGQVQEILLRGKRLLAIGSQPYAAPKPGPEPVPLPMPIARAASSLPVHAPTGVRLTEIDVSDPAAMKVARTLDVDGSYVSARLTGGTARVVLNTPPHIVLDTAQPGTGDAPVTSAPASTDATKEAIGKAGVRAFVPETLLHSNISGRTFRRQLVGCGQVRHPVAFSGLDLLTVLSVDLDRGLFNVDRDAVIAGAQVVYASEGSLYVASQRWIQGLDMPGEIPSGMQTEIHRFDTGKAGETTYRSSGQVPGFVLNQYALSEHRGDLRVASTEEPLWMAGAPQRDSESAVTILREQGGRLERVGRVAGLGRGERIYAARFLGDVGYLVTFRQVDPLYTLDLSDPAAPKVAGELKITGYSAYLHPIGEDLLLGVGQDATEQGRRVGAQVSVFDVSDPASPKRLHQRPLGGSGSSSSAEFDPHAFLWWGPARTAVLPLQEYTNGATFSGAVGLRVRKAEGIDEIARITHPGEPYTASIKRTMVVGKRVFTFSDQGVGAAALETLAPLGFLAFPAN
jgi:uncharacterized secreted protein with C-terminal beta-propeller domain